MATAGHCETAPIGPSQAVPGAHGALQRAWSARSARVSARREQHPGDASPATLAGRAKSIGLSARDFSCVGWRRNPRRLRGERDASGWPAHLRKLRRRRAQIGEGRESNGLTVAGLERETDACVSAETATKKRPVGCPTLRLAQLGEAVALVTGAATPSAYVRVFQLWPEAAGGGPSPCYEMGATRKAPPRRSARPGTAFGKFRVAPRPAARPGRTGVPPAPSTRSPRVPAPACGPEAIGPALAGTVRHRRGAPPQTVPR
eukprot:scaffold7214_cov410-Prasinococcus_capsulatus_cf.AAC.19